MSLRTRTCKSSGRFGLETDNTQARIAVIVKQLILLVKKKLLVISQRSKINGTHKARHVFRPISYYSEGHM